MQTRLEPKNGNEGKSITYPIVPSITVESCKCCDKPKPNHEQVPHLVVFFIGFFVVGLLLGILLGWSYKRW